MLIATHRPPSAIGSAMTIAEAIRACFESRHTQETLAEATGIPQQTISRLARGETRPQLAQLTVIEQACDRPVGWILIQAGYVENVLSVPAAIAVAPELSDHARGLLMKAYEALVNPEKD